jgi:hypothetical protein
VVVDSQIQIGIVLFRIDEKRRGLLAALVAARRLARFEGGNQPLRKRQRRRFICFRGFPDDLLVGEHVASHGESRAGERSAPVDALRAGVLADAPLRVDDVQLAVLAPFVGGDEALRHLGGGNARAQELEPLFSVVRVDQRLGGERADAAFRVRAERADREEARRDRNAERAARVARYDRPRHGRRS